MKSRTPVLPLPMSVGMWRSPLASPGRQAGEENEALTASAPVASGLITDMVLCVKVVVVLLIKTIASYCE